jgi:hypothetical protein
MSGSDGAEVTVIEGGDFGDVEPLGDGDKPQRQWFPAGSRRRSRRVGHALVIPNLEINYQYSLLCN